MTTRVGRQQQVCPVDLTGIPSCASGPTGRLAFVVRELAGAVRRRRNSRREEWS